jgi:hypothetical protein
MRLDIRRHAGTLKGLILAYAGSSQTLTGQLKGSFRTRCAMNEMMREFPFHARGGFKKNLMNAMKFENLRKGKFELVHIGGITSGRATAGSSAMNSTFCSFNGSRRSFRP